MFTIETIARYEYFNIAWYNTSSISYTQKKLRLFVISIYAHMQATKSQVTREQFDNHFGARISYASLIYPYILRRPQFS